MAARTVTEALLPDLSSNFNRSLRSWNGPLQKMRTIIEIYLYRYWIQHILTTGLPENS